jgi:hypothetical protein
MCIFNKIVFTADGKLSRKIYRKSIQLEELYLAILQRRVLSLMFNDDESKTQFLETISKDKNLYSLFMCYLNIVGY